jgi:hypothetical protein
VLKRIRTTTASASIRGRSLFVRQRAVMDGTALVGKASQIFKATLRKLAEID